ncbi:protein FAR1-RELATED SEQUENCE 7-like [Pyrus ussuriensis x Pyrus communis]|uniref:Protein FAR1-RELATED SEQUENCE n=1 Tax=Pyrus ussuriensis x Pyrus communis TaxID=2448454 RepID=A0A5N5G969_9ROSA|nr:protein FAR1-RELATED SEQUENCE 7-like [Pyrus ussuriensis x Pyrus communis]
MDGKAPRTIFTYQAQSIAAAISEVFPNCHHRLCLWHIYQKAARNLNHVLSECIYDPETVEEFESSWNKLLDDYELRGNDWLEGIYLLHEKWAQVYGRDHFCVEFVVQYDKAVPDRKGKERQAENATKQKWRSLYSDWNVEIEATKQYTILCSCKKFEFEGILCAHALKLYYDLDLSSIPSNYYLKRWSKDAKCGIRFDSYGEPALEKKLDKHANFGEQDDGTNDVNYVKHVTEAEKNLKIQDPKVEKSKGRGKGRMKSALESNQPKKKGPYKRKAFKESNSNAYEMNGPSTRYAQTQGHIGMPSQNQFNMAPENIQPIPLVTTPQLNFSNPSTSNIQPIPLGTTLKLNFSNPSTS